MSDMLHIASAETNTMLTRCGTAVQISRITVLCVLAVHWSSWLIPGTLGQLDSETSFPPQSHYTSQLFSKTDFVTNKSQQMKNTSFHLNLVYCVYQTYKTNFVVLIKTCLSQVNYIHVTKTQFISQKGFNILNYNHAIAHFNSFSQIYFHWSHTVNIDKFFILILNCCQKYLLTR